MLCLARFGDEELEDDSIWEWGECVVSFMTPGRPRRELMFFLIWKKTVSIFFDPNFS